MSWCTQLKFWVCLDMDLVMHMVWDLEPHRGALGQDLGLDLDLDLRELSEESERETETV